MLISEGFISDFDSIPLIVSKISTQCFVFHAGQGLATVTCSGSVSVEISIDFLKVFTLTIVCLFGFLMSSSTSRLYCRRAPRQSVWQFYVLPHMRQSWETMTSISAGHLH